jgi:hypothetical protein
MSEIFNKLEGILEEDELVMKGKALPVGHITTTRSGKKVQKQGDGSWKPVKGEGKAKVKDKKEASKKGKGLERKEKRGGGKKKEKESSIDKRMVKSAEASWKARKASKLEFNHSELIEEAKKIKKDKRFSKDNKKKAKKKLKVSSGQSDRLKKIEERKDHVSHLLEAKKDYALHKKGLKHKKNTESKKKAMDAKNRMSETRKQMKEKYGKVVLKSETFGKLASLIEGE